MKQSLISRRRFLLAATVTAALGAPGAAVADAKWLEPGWVKVRRIRLGNGRATHRLVQVTDIHHKGDRAYLASVVKKINALSPDLVCFTGDLIEQPADLPGALELLGGIKSPVFGVPGNHDYWSRASFDQFAKGFTATGGAWLMDEQRVTPDGKLCLLGATCRTAKQRPLVPPTTTRNVLLMHYPAWVKRLETQKYDLILAGHSHGGQVRLPLYGPLLLPWGVDEYDLGMFHTANGPLYVNPGIGWFPVPIRFNCRPEITVFEL